jgi:hypothetical protein
VVPRALAERSPAQREVMTVRELNGWSGPEVCEVLGSLGCRPAAALASSTTVAHLGRFSTPAAPVMRDVRLATEGPRSRRSVRFGRPRQRPTARCVRSVGSPTCPCHYGRLNLSVDPASRAGVLPPAQEQAHEALTGWSLLSSVGGPRSNRYPKPGATGDPKPRLCGDGQPQGSLFRPPDSHPGGGGGLGAHAECRRECGQGLRPLRSRPQHNRTEQHVHTRLRPAVRPRPAG